MPSISLEPTVYIKAQPQEVIAAQQTQTQSSVTTALNEAQIQPATPVLSEKAVYAQLDTMATRHLRPMSDKEYFFLVDILKKNGFTSEKLYQLHDLYAIAVAVLTNYYAFKRPEELDPIVEDTVADISSLPSYSLDSFNKSLENFYTVNWFGKTIAQAGDCYSEKEKLVFGSLGIAFVDEYNEYKKVEQAAQDIYDAGDDERNEEAVNLATGTILQQMAPAVNAAAALVEAGKAVTTPVVVNQKRTLTYEQQVHPMLRYGLVARKK